MHELKIPKGRVGCLIGKNGETKKVIERSTKTKIKVTTEGDLEIFGDGFGEYLCEKVVKAVGRGFNPDLALNLVRDGYGLEIIDIGKFSGGNKKKFMRIKARLIGKRGKARMVIERLTECHVSVYGKTVSIIGELDKLHIAFRGMEKLMHGSPHGNVYVYLEREMAKLRY
ncbi:MAG: KH domain-containing protein [Nanoarchaeota archaeon]